MGYFDALDDERPAWWLFQKWFFRQMANLVSCVGIVFGLIGIYALLFCLTLSGLLVSIIFTCLGGFTDLIDGPIARKYHIVSRFGKFIDRMREKIIHCSCFCILATRYWDHSQFWPVTQILSGGIVFLEILLILAWYYGHKTDQDTGASWPGKVKVWTEYIALELWLTNLYAEKAWGSPYLANYIGAVNFFLAISIFFASWGMYNYLRRYKLI